MNVSSYSDLITIYRDKTAIKVAFIFLISLILVYFRFASWTPSIFYQDDLNGLMAFYDGSYASTIKQSLLESFVGKYRPVFQLLCHFLYSTFDKKIEFYLMFNFIIQGINCILFFLISARLTQKKFVVAFLLTAAFAVSRLALYQVTQITGPVESVAMSFFLTMIYAVLRSMNDPKPIRWQWIAILSITLAMFTHERYIVVLPWLAVVLFYTSTKMNRSFTYRCSLLLTCIALLYMNYFIKVSLLHITFFTGTGGSTISINMQTIISQLHQAFFSLLGFNNGPAYLIGQSIFINPFIMGNHFFPWLMAVTFSLSYIFIIARSIVTSTLSLKLNISYLLTILSLIGLLLVPPILSIRLEGRWEYAPFTLILLSLAWAYGLPKRIPSKPIGIVCILASIAIIFVDSKISNSFDHIFMMGWAKFGRAIKTDILPSFAQQNTNKLLLLADKATCDALNTSRIFELYVGKNPVLSCAETKDDLIELVNAHPRVLALEYNNFKFTKYNQ